MADISKITLPDGNTYNLKVTSINNLLQEDNKEYITNTDPYIYRASPSNFVKQKLDQIVGGTVAWNQLFGDIDVIGSSTSTAFTASVLENNVGFNAVLNTDLEDGNSISRVVYYRCTDFSLVSGHKYLFIGNIKTNITSIYRVNGYWTSFADDAVGNGTSAISDKYYYVMFIANTTRSGSCLHRLYLYGINGTTEQYFDYEDIQTIDLTAMFGSTIADHIYSLEQSSAGAGVAWLKQYIDLDTYHAYDAGSLESVQTEGREVVGFNQLDKDASYTIDGSHYRYFDLPIGATNTLYISFTDKDTSVNVSGINFGFVSTNYGAATSYIWNMQSGVIHPNHSNVANAGSSGVFGIKCQYAFMYPNTNDALTRLFKRYDICINLSDPAKNGTYKPYEKHTYPVSNVVLRGIPKLVDNQLSFDGDVYAADGTVERRYGEYTFTDEETWEYNNTYGVFMMTKNIGAYRHTAQSGYVKFGIMSNGFSQYGRCEADMPDRVFVNNSTAHGTNKIYIKDTRYTAETIADFKASIAGVKLTFLIATPTTETADPYAPVQAAGDTERWIDDRAVPVPVGHVTKYPVDSLSRMELLFADSFIVNGHTVNSDVPANAVFTDTDTQVTNTLAATTKSYLTGTATATTNTGTQNFDTGVYLTETAGQMNATTYKVNEAVILQFNSITQALDFIFT